MTTVATLYITVDNKGAIRATKQVGEQVQKTGTVIDDENKATVASNEESALSFGKLRDAASGLIGIVGLAGVAFGIKDVIDQGEQWQQQQNNLRASLKSTGQYSAAAMKQVDSSVNALATHGGFDATAQVEAISELTTETGKLTTAQKLNVAATSLARGASMSYQSSTSMVEAAVNGQTRGLSRLIGAITPVTQYTYGWTAAMRAANNAAYEQRAALNRAATAQIIFGKLQQLYGDRTAKYSASLPGQLSNVRNAAMDLARTIGESLLPALLKVAHAAMDAVGWIQAHWPAIKGIILTAFAPVLWVVKMLGGLKTVIIAVLVVAAGFAAVKAVMLGYAAAMKVVTAVTWLFEAATNAVRFATAVAALVQGTYVATVEASAAAQLACRAVNIAATAAIYAVNAAQWVLNGAMVAGAADALAFAAAMMLDPVVLVIVAITAAIILVITHFGTFKKIVVDAFNAVKSVVMTVVGFLTSEWNNFFKIIMVPINAIGGAFSSAFNGVKKVVTTVVDWIWNKIQWLAKEITKIWNSSPLGGLFNFGKDIVEGHVAKAVGALAHGLTFGVVGSNAFVGSKSPVAAAATPSWSLRSNPQAMFAAMMAAEGQPTTSAVSPSASPTPVARNSSVPTVLHRAGDINTTIPITLNMDSRPFTETVIHNVQKRTALS